MKYTQKEILEIQRVIATVNIPFIIDSTDQSKVKLIYKHDKNIFAHCTRLLQYACFAKNPTGVFESYVSVDFPNFIIILKTWLIEVKKEHPNNFNRLQQIENFSPRFYPTF